MNFLTKLVCIENFKDSSLESELTYGKIYSPKAVASNYSQNFPSNYYFIINDNNTLEKYHSKYFVTIEEWRQNQLNKIL
jgi:hypothetical protein